MFCGQLRTVAEDFFYFRSISVFSTLEVSCENALYKLTVDVDIHLDTDNGISKSYHSGCMLYVLSYSSNSGLKERSQVK